MDAEQRRREFEAELTRNGTWTEFWLGLTRYAKSHGCSPEAGFSAYAEIYKQNAAVRAEVKSAPGQLTFVQCAEWAFENLGREVEPEEAPSAGAYSLLIRAKADPSVLDQPLMLASKRRADEERDREIERWSDVTEKQIRELIDKLLAEPLV